MFRVKSTASLLTGMTDKSWEVNAKQLHKVQYNLHEGRVHCCVILHQLYLGVPERLASACRFI